VSKIRIYELAKETGLPNKEVIRRLAEFGVEAKSHSSTVEEADASRFRESLGKQREERRRQQEERARLEAEQYDVESLQTSPAEAKARRILPPHLRQQQPAAGQPAAGGAGATAARVSSPGAPSGDMSAQDQPRRFRPPTTPFRPAGESTGVSVGGHEEAAPQRPPGPDEPPVAPPTPPEQPQQPAAQTPAPPPSAAEAARAGVVRPPPPAEPQPAVREEETGPRGVPGVPRPGTPPRPGQPIRRPVSPAATGMPIEPRRRVDHDLPREGSGKRYIPPPVRPAPPKQDAAPRHAAAGRGRPSTPAGPGAAPRTAPGRPGGPGRAPAAPAPDRGAPAPGPGPGRVKKAKKAKRKKEPTLQEQFEAEAQPRRGRTGPVKATVSGPVDVVPGVTVGEFAKLVGINPTDVVRVLFGMGEMITVTQSMSQDLIELVAAELDADVRFVTPEELEFGPEPEDGLEELGPRPPVVTVMGHVDHGKTLLLDTIRHTDVVSREAGGITQHIGAYQVTKDGRAITFIDTPGHEAFTQMRARGARVTDVAILVVAADDGVKPQTVEAINHIKAAEVPMIVAVNKVDKDTADPVRVRTQLTEHGLVAEEFGGDTTMVDVSALTSQGIDDLLDMVLLQADILELKANSNRRARGAVIEAHLDKGRGNVATVLVENGTLRNGDSLVAGSADCKVRAMFDADGLHVDAGGPATPVQVLGWNDLPDAGDEFRVVEDERTARDIAENRQARQRRMELAERRTLSLEELSGAIAEGELQSLNLIVKGDVAGSVEAVADAIEKLELPEVKVRIVHKGVGAVTENDVSLAEASDAIIIAFNVRPEANARAAIEASGIDLRQYSVIYQAVEDIERAVKGLLAPEYEEVVVGRAEVREIFRVPRMGFVFGCYVTEGTLRRNAKVRVVRDGVVAADDRIGSLRRFKDDVTEVATGFECGVGLDRFQDVKVGDEFEVYEQREVTRA
jgi:translation initiation factor IF-2